MHKKQQTIVSGAAYRFTILTAELIRIEEPTEFDLSDQAFCSAYFELVHHPLEEQSIDFWWIDWEQGGVGTSDRIDPLCLLNHYHLVAGRGAG